MTDYFSYSDLENLLSCIDRSIKKAREIEKNKYPYAVVINQKNGQNFKIDSFTCMSKNGFRSVPVVKHPNVKENRVHIAYNEPELIEIIQKNTPLS